MRFNNYNQMIRDFVEMADTMSRRLSELEHEAGEATESTRMMRLPIDAYSTQDAFVLQAYVPGVNPEDVEIVLAEDDLTIRGKFPPLLEGVDYIKRELYHGGFERRVTFNVPVDAEKIEATYSQGVLTLRVPKAEAVKPKQIKVQVK